MPIIRSSEIARENVARAVRTPKRISRAREVRRLYFNERLTQREIASRVGLSQAAVSRIVRGEALPEENQDLREEARDAATN